MDKIETTRKMMEIFGKNRVYTNQYETMVTVKCYKGTDDAPMIAAIKTALAEIDESNFNVKVTNHAVDWDKPGNIPPDSIIVQFPFFNTEVFGV